jgi:hypothetical protein
MRRPLALKVASNPELQSSEIENNEFRSELSEKMWALMFRSVPGIEI